jgi:tetratricopeptide (TPR) repeat protein
VAVHARDAHNLYLETLAELGPFGLALLVGTLLLPLLALREARHRPLGPTAVAAFAAFLVHAGIDWDWELPVVTVPAILCGVTLLVRPDEERFAWLTARRRVTALALLVPLVGVALVAHVGNRAAAGGIRAIEDGEPERALREARRAVAWAPWSEDAWQLRGQAELGLASDAAARRSLARALELNDRSWSIWFDLAVASTGSGRDRALERAKALNPLSSEVEELQTER